MDYKTLGKKLLEIRKQKKISQNQMTRELNISRVTISALEKGGGNVGIKTVMQIAAYLGQQIELSQYSRFPTFEELKNER